MLEMKTALIGIAEAGITALLGYAVVFFGLVLLMCVVMGLGKVMTAKTQKPAPVAEAKPAEQPAPEVKKEEAKGSKNLPLLRSLKKKIEEELEYPGQIKVNIIRESRSVDYAK